MTVSETHDVDVLRDHPGSYVRNERVLWRRAAGSVLLLRGGAHDVVLLDDSACLLWRLLDRPRAFDQIVDLLSEAYGTGGQQVAADVAAALARLTSLDVVTHTPEDVSYREDTG